MSAGIFAQLTNEAFPGLRFGKSSILSNRSLVSMGSIHHFEFKVHPDLASVLAKCSA